MSELDDWIKSRPPKIQKMIKQLPPDKLYVLKGQEELGQYQPLAYSEDGTVRCLKTDFMGLQYQVFGMNPNDLTDLEKEREE